MAATRENVLSAIVQYVEQHKRRAPAKDIAVLVGDTLPNVQATIKALVAEGAISSSRGRNGGALPPGVTLPKKAVVKAAVSEPAESEESTESEESSISPDVADQFAALLQQLDSSDNLAAVG